MNFQIDRDSDVPLRDQVSRQLAFLISVGALRPGQPLPSIRALATRLKLHHNTILHAYRDLAAAHFVERRLGTQMLVAGMRGAAGRSRALDLDEIINICIQLAQDHGFSLHQLREQVKKRMATPLPEGLLVITDEPGLRELIRMELATRFFCRVDACTVSELTSRPARASNALVVAPHGTLQQCAAVLPKSRQPFVASFNPAEPLLDQVRALKEPSAIAVVSVSPIILRTAHALLSPALGTKHTLCEFGPAKPAPGDLRAFALVFCDSAMHGQIQIGRAHV